MIIAANISLLRVVGKQEEMLPDVLKKFVETPERDEVIDDFFKEEYEPDDSTESVKKKK